MTVSSCLTSWSDRSARGDDDGFNAGLEEPLLFFITEKKISSHVEQHLHAIEKAAESKHEERGAAHGTLGVVGLASPA
jgi:hypothetical protein